MKVIGSISLAVVGALVGFGAYYTFTGKNLLSSKEAKKMIKNKEVKFVIDVRTKAEYNLGHYKNALHFPGGSMNPKSIASFQKKNNIKKDDGLLVYCNTGQRARNAAEKLEKEGFTKVYYIAGTYLSL